ncbi:MAG TPA: hypothetical protein VIK01_08765 [Polyangiaceae bacterium]
MLYQVIRAPSGGASVANNSGAARLGRGGGSAGAVGTAGNGGALSSGGANAGAGEAGLSECFGNAPQCRGTNLTQCCGNDPYGPATCHSGKWLCSLGQSPAVAAPGCNGHICGQQIGGQAGAGGEAGQTGDAGASSTACTGRAPNCFGGNLQTCCGHDPAGPATCHNGQWLCFGVAAPGCNGQTCI